jgi:hypothetical protein
MVGIRIFGSKFDSNKRQPFNRSLTQKNILIFVHLPHLLVVIGFAVSVGYMSPILKRKELTETVRDPRAIYSCPTRTVLAEENV